MSGVENLKSKHSFKAIELRTLIIQLFITIVMLIIVETIMTNRIKNYYYNNLKEVSVNSAKNYSYSLAKATEAQVIVNSLLEEKILAASKIVGKYDGEYSNNLLKEMADNLEVDVIYYYSPQGEIIYSNDGEYIGWRAYENHPVHDFMIKDDMNYVGDIRKDSDSERYYKYAYLKSSTGNFVQIGVIADKVHNLLESFEVQVLLNEMKETQSAVQISFIDTDLNITGSTDEILIGTELTDNQVIGAISASNEYYKVGNLDNSNVYEVYIPVYLKENKIGTIHAIQSLKATEELIKKIKNIGITGLFIIFISIFYVTISIYYKNKQLIKLALYDSLTDLPNREYLMNYMKEIIQDKSDINRAVLLINCINFKTINLISGYQYGDKILTEIAYKLKGVGSHYKTFRFSSDRFIIYMDNYNDSSDLVELSYKIGEEFKDPLIAKNIEVQIGIVEIGNKYDEVDQVLKDVSIALDNIIKNDINYAFFNKDMEKKLDREYLIESEIRVALSEVNTNKIYLEFQPQVDLKTNKIIGFEALARMKTESLGFVSPLEFIDIAERKYLIVPLGYLILRKACDFINSLKRNRYNNIKVAVNVSGIQLLKDDFTDMVGMIIKEYGINGSNLELEITESILMDNYGIINEKLKKLRDMNIKIALDDFGTGYSSFSLLRDLNIDFVKLDRYFINRIKTKEHNELITGDIISMSHKIGLAVVAEGVEIEVQKDYLIENNCDIMQGYLFSKPLPGDAALKILENSTRS